MALGLIGVLDLSIVTDRLIELLTTYRDNSPMWTIPGTPDFHIDISGSAPDVVRGENGGCVLSLYLFHVAADKQQRNSPVPHFLPPATPPPTGLRVRAIPFHPLGLDLYYLLTAWAEKSYVHEQQAMSIALKCFHENPIVRKTVLIEGKDVPEEFTLTMEMESADELGRLWQSTTMSSRLATVFRVSVVFITPPVPAVGVAPTPTRVGLSVDVTELPLNETGQLFGTHRTFAYRSPDATTPQPDLRTVTIAPAAVAAGESFVLLGTKLDKAATQNTFLLDGPNEFDITAPWHAAGADDTATRRNVTLPATIGAPPANTPPAGVYQIRVGDATHRSNATPFSIAARIDPPAPAAMPILAPVAGVYTLQGSGFITGHTALSVGPAELTESGGAPATGEFAIGGGGTSIDFRLPAASLPNGVHGIRVQVNHVESAPAWWVEVP